MLLASCGHSSSAASQGMGRHHAVTPASISTTTAKTTSVQPQRELAGIIAPFQNVAITSALSEPALRVNVLEGDHVQAGQTLAVFDVSDLQGQLTTAEGTLKNAQASAQAANSQVSETQYNAHLTIATGSDNVHSSQAALEQAQATLRNDSANLQRDQTLASQGYIPQQTLDQQRTLVVNDQGAVRTAEANLGTASVNQSINGTSSQGLPASTIAAAQHNAQAAAATIQTQQGQIQTLQSQIAKAVIVSPVSGVVVNRNLNAGEYPNGRTLFTVQELDKVYLNLNASSSDIFAIPKGTAVTAQVSGTPRKYSGSINAVLGQVSPGSTNFTVQAIIKNSDGMLQAGLPATADIRLPAVYGVGIPTAAFLDDTHTTVMGIAYSGSTTKGHTLNVTEKASNGTTSIVTGVPAGAKVIGNGQLGITEGQTILIDGATPAPVASAPADGSGSDSPQSSASPSGHRHHNTATSDQ
jgi:HlyD family secretion protein